MAFLSAPPTLPQARAGRSAPVCARRAQPYAGARGHKRRHRHAKASAGKDKASAAAATAGAESAAVTSARGLNVDESPGIPQDVLNCCVKLYVTHAPPNYSMPWQFDRQTSSTSTGFIMEGRCILTCAHCVEHSTTVMVKRRGSDVKHLARVVAVGNECDTAILTVDSAVFWDELEAVAEELGELPYLEPGPLPMLQEECAVVGFPSPGESVCVTQGVCSRVEVSPYTFSTTSHLLAVQLDAAINGGNSGGPVLDEDLRCVGIAFQSIDAAEGEAQGFFVPMLIVQHFLRDVEMNDGKYTGFPHTGFRHQSMENVGLRRAFGRSDEDRDGILIQAVDATSDASRVLKPGDIVIALDGVPVSYSGTVPFREQLGERIDLSFLVTSRFVGEKMRIAFIRDGKNMNAAYTLPAMGSGRLVPTHAPRQYIVYGGLVFLALSEPYLVSEFESDFYASAPLSLLNAYYYGRREADGGRQEVIVLAHVLASPCNAGYDDFRAVTVTALNGETLNSLAHLALLLDQNDAEFLRFDTDRHETIILDKAMSLAESPRILEMHAIPAPRVLADI